MQRFLTFFLVLAMSTAILAGCGDKKTVMVDEDTKATITEGNDGEVSMTVNDEEAGDMTMQAGKNLSLPANWPKGELPLYSGSEIVFVMNNKDASTGKESAMVAIGCDGSIPDVAAFYKGKLSSASDFSAMEVDNYFMFGGVKGDVGFNVVINNEKGGDWSGSKEYPTYVLITYYQP